MADELSELSTHIERLHREAVARGDEYYIDPVTGFLTMTELHHLTRGSCCENNCRHCPYRQRSEVD